MSPKHNTTRNDLFVVRFWLEDTNGAAEGQSGWGRQGPEGRDWGEPRVQRLGRAGKRFEGYARNEFAPISG